MRVYAAQGQAMIRKAFGSGHQFMKPTEKELSCKVTYVDLLVETKEVKRICYQLQFPDELNTDQSLQDTHISNSFSTSSAFTRP